MASFLAEVFQAWCHQDTTVLFPSGTTAAATQTGQNSLNWLTQGLSQLPPGATLHNTLVNFQGFPKLPNEARTDNPIVFEEGYAFALELIGITDQARITQSARANTEHAFAGHVAMAKQVGLGAEVALRLYNIVSPEGVSVGSYVAPLEVYYGKVSLANLVRISNAPADPSSLDTAVAQTILSLFPKG